MSMQLVGVPQPITKLDLSKDVDVWTIYGVDGEVRFHEAYVTPSALEEVRRHMRVGDLLLAVQDGKVFVGTLHMTTTLSPLNTSL